MLQSNFSNNIIQTKTVKNCVIAVSSMAGAGVAVYLGTIAIPSLVFKAGEATTLASLPHILPIMIKQHLATNGGMFATTQFTAWTGIGFNSHTAGISAGIGSQAGRFLAKTAIQKIVKIYDKYHPHMDFSAHFPQHKFQTVDEFEMVNISDFKEKELGAWVNISTDDDQSTECSESITQKKSSSDDRSISHSDKNTLVQRINADIKQQQEQEKSFIEKSYNTAKNAVNGLYKQCSKNFVEKIQQKPRSSSVSK